MEETKLEVKEEGSTLPVRAEKSGTNKHSGFFKTWSIQSNEGKIDLKEETVTRPEKSQILSPNLSSGFFSVPLPLDIMPEEVAQTRPL